jgi:hypothetical protein
VLDDGGEILGSKMKSMLGLHAQSGFSY